MTEQQVVSDRHRAYQTDLPMSADAPRPLNRRDVKTLVLAALGGALEFYDFVIFVFFTAVIGQLFFPPDIPEWLRQLQAYGIFAAGYFARPLGGLIMAHFGDRAGRKRMFTLSVFLMAVPTLLIGFLPVYSSIGYFAPLALLVLRVLQGAAIGGEVPGAWVFVAEHVPARRIGLACGLLTSGLTAGILIGSLVATGINLALTPDQIHLYGWRLPFIAGGFFGFFAVYLRSWLAETPIFIEISRRKALSRELPLKAILKYHGKAILVSALTTWTLTAAIVVMILMTPNLLQKLLGFSPVATLEANSLATLTLSIACVLAGIAADRFGAVRVMVIGGLSIAASSYLLYLGAAPAPGLLLPLYALTGLCVGSIAVVPFIMVRVFPPEIRFTGVSFAYNIAYAVFGGLTPLVVAKLTTINPLAPVHYVAAIVLVGILAVLGHVRWAGAASIGRIDATDR
jgi:MFS family permease